MKGTVSSAVVVRGALRIAALFKNESHSKGAIYEGSQARRSAGSERIVICHCTVAARDVGAGPATASPIRQIEPAVRVGRHSHGVCARGRAGDRRLRAGRRSRGGDGHGVAHPARRLHSQRSGLVGGRGDVRSNDVDRRRDDSESTAAVHAGRHAVHDGRRAADRDEHRRRSDGESARPRSEP